MWCTHKKECTIHLTKLLDKLRGKHGGDSFLVADASNKLGVLYERQELFDDAKKCYEEVVRIDSLQSEYNNNVAGNLYNLGMIARKQGDDGKAREMYEKALHITTSVHGVDHMRSLPSLQGLVILSEKKENWEEALQRYKRILRIYQTDALNRSAEITMVRTNISIILGKLGKLKKAIKICKQVVSSTRSTDNQLDIGHALVHLAASQIDASELVGARDSLEEALPILRRITGEKSSTVAGALNLLANIYNLEHNLDQALRVHHKALRYSTRGPVDPSLKQD